MSPLTEQQQSTPRRRDLEKCHRCRRNKQKCEPAERDWMTAKEKCKRCQSLGYECGPPEPTTRKIRLQESTSERSPRSSFCAPVILPNLKDAGKEVGYLPSTKRLSMEVVLRDIWYNQVQSMINVPQCGNDISLEGVIGQTAVGLAVQRLLLCCQLDMQSIDRRTGFPQSSTTLSCPFSAVQTFLHGVMDMVMSDTRLQLTSLDPARLSSLDATKREPEEQKLELWRYKETTQQWQQRLASTDCARTSTKAGLNEANAEPTPYKLQVLACTEYVVLDRNHSEPVPTVLLQESLSRSSQEDYTAAATDIRLFMTGLYTALSCSWETPDDKSSQVTVSKDILKMLHNAFPASHIAYWNHDKIAANSLWSCGRASMVRTDLFGRSYAHIATEAGDLETLRFIGQQSQNSEAIWNAGEDVHGRTLLHVAAALGNRDVFTIILDRCADTCQKAMPIDAKLLELAVRGGSRAIIRRLFRDNMVEAPYTAALARAIEMSLTDIADSLIEQMQKIRHSDEDLLYLASHAAKHNQYGLQRKLYMMKYPSAIVHHSTNYVDYLSTSDWPAVEKVGGCQYNMTGVPDTMPGALYEVPELAEEDYTTSIFSDLDSSDPYSSLSEMSAPDDSLEFITRDMEYSDFLSDTMNGIMPMCHEPLSMIEQGPLEIPAWQAKPSFMTNDRPWSARWA